MLNSGDLAPDGCSFRKNAATTQSVEVSIRLVHNCGGVADTIVRLVNLRAIDAGGDPLSAKSPSEGQVRRSLLSILARTKLCALATVDSRRSAHSSHVYFAYSPDLMVYFLSDPKSNHCRHLRTNPSMSVSVYDSRQRWGGPDRGIAMYGLCRELRGGSRDRAELFYGGRFPAYRSWRREVLPDDEGAKWRFFGFVPRHVKVFDEIRLGTGVFVTASVQVDRKKTK